MKKLLLLSFLICSLGHAQDYIPMLQEGNVWSVDVYDNIYDPPPNVPCCNINTYQIYIGGTEVINGITYDIITGGAYGDCFVREENGVVYKYDEYGTQTDKVWIDMNLEVGDVFNLMESGYYFSPCVGGGSIFDNQMTVTEVEFLEIAGATRKVISFDNGNNHVQFQWIEGIGNSSGFDMLFEQLDITDGSQLVCFSRNGESYFFNNATSCDNTTLGFEENSEEKIILYPNPVTTTSILKFPGNLSVDTIRIYNLAGRLVKEEILIKDYYRIEMMDYRSGLYFYQVLLKNEVIVSNPFIIH